MNQLDFQGRHAVVTGGATGLGYAIAQRLLASGGSVTLWDRDEAGARQAAAALGSGAHAVAVDVAQQPSVAAAVQATLQQAGRIDALVNSAGITGPNTKVWDYPVDAWRQVMDVNLTGLFICCREVAPHMRERNYGRIVNIASVAGKDGNPNASSYSASKAGVMALTKSLGKELADHGVVLDHAVGVDADQTQVMQHRAGPFEGVELRRARHLAIASHAVVLDAALVDARRHVSAAPETAPGCRPRWHRRGRARRSVWSPAGLA